MKDWARHNLIGNPFLVNEERQCTPHDGYICNNGVPYALRFWPQGDRRKRGGTITVHLNDGVADINGSSAARASLLAFVKDWVQS